MSENVNTYGDFEYLLPCGATVFYINEQDSGFLIYESAGFKRGSIKGFSVVDGKIESYTIKPIDRVWSHGAIQPIADYPNEIVKWYLVSDSSDGFVRVLESMIEQAKKLKKP